MVGDDIFVVDKVGSQGISCKEVVVGGTLTICTLEVVGNEVDLFYVLVLVELEKHCSEVGCFNRSFGFVVVVVDNWVGFEEGLNSKVAYQ